MNKAQANFLEDHYGFYLMDDDISISKKDLITFLEEYSEVNSAPDFVPAEYECVINDKVSCTASGEEAERWLLEIYKTFYPEEISEYKKHSHFITESGNRFSIRVNTK